MAFRLEATFADTLPLYQTRPAIHYRTARLELLIDFECDRLGFACRKVNEKVVDETLLANWVKLGNNFNLTNLKFISPIIKSNSKLTRSVHFRYIFNKKNFVFCSYSVYQGILSLFLLHLCTLIYEIMDNIYSITQSLKIMNNNALVAIFVFKEIFSRISRKFDAKSWSLQ